MTERQFHTRTMSVSKYTRPDGEAIAVAIGECVMIWMTAGEARQLAIDLVTAAEVFEQKIANQRQLDAFDEIRQTLNAPEA